MYELDDNFQWRLKKLPFCASEEEVWELMGDVIMPESDNSKFSDEIIQLKDNIQRYSSIKIDKDAFGLGIRLLYMFRMNGYLGYVNYGSGPLYYLKNLRQMISVIQQNKEYCTPMDINVKARDFLIQHDTRKGNLNTSIKIKINYLNNWLTLAPYLPYFLTINPDTMEGSSIYNDFLDKYLKEIDLTQDAKNNKAVFPIHLLSPVLSKAIHYIEHYTEDILLLATQREAFFLNKHDNSRGARSRKIIQSLKTTAHTFTEPSLTHLQHYCKTLVGNTWKSNPQHYGVGPLTIVSEAITRLQAACAIVILTLTSARSQELLLQPRNVKMPKTKHHELDHSYNFTRIIWKTARYGKIHTVPIAPIGAKAYQTLSKLSEYFDGKKTGQLYLSSISGNDMPYKERLRDIIRNFSQEVNGEDAPALNPHQLRHAMVSIITLLNDVDGLTLAAMLTGHTSFKNTIDYTQQLRTMIHRQFQYLADQNTDLEEAVIEYEESISIKVLDEKVAPKIREGKHFFGNAAHYVSSGNIIRNVEADIAVHEAQIKQGQASLRDLGYAYCWHDAISIERTPCQRGFDTNYDGILPIMPVACIGSECKHYFKDEDQVAAMMESANQLKACAPEDLQERAGEWLYVINNGLSETDTKMVEKYKMILEKRIVNA
jgi:hypothetical protein